MKKRVSRKAVTKKKTARPRPAARAKVKKGRKVRRAPARKSKMQARRSTRSSASAPGYGDSPTTELTAGPNQDSPEPGADPTLPTNFVRGVPGHQVPDVPSEDDDREGRSVTERLVEGGAKEAERDKVRRADRPRG